MRINRLVNSSFPITQRFRRLMFTILNFYISIQKQRLMQPFFCLFSMWSFLTTTHLISCFLMWFCLWMFVWWIMTGWFIMMIMIMMMRFFFLRFDYVIFVAKDLLFGLEELKVGRSVLRHLVVIFYFEFTCHWLYFNNEFLSFFEHHYKVSDKWICHYSLFC